MSSPIVRISRPFYYLSVALLSVLCDSLALGAQAPQLLTVGHQIGEGTWSHAAGEWLALERGAGGFALRQVTVRSARETSICGGVGFNITAGELPAGTFLVRGIPALRPGPVTTIFAGEKYLTPGELLRLQPGDQWALRAAGKVAPTVNAGRGETRTTDYAVFVEAPSRKAMVFSLLVVDNDGPPQIIWVGHLDADDVPDILADVRTHYAGHTYTLFLSSAAKAEQLLSAVAFLRTAGC